MDQESACRYHSYVLIEKLKYGDRKINQVTADIIVVT